MDTNYTNYSGVPAKEFGRGDKAVILALHGFGGSKESSAIELLGEKISAAGGKVVAIDLPGHGENGRVSDCLTVSECQRDILLTAERIRADHPDAGFGVFATSFGGYNALIALKDLEKIFGEFPLVLRAPAVSMARTFRRAIAGRHFKELIDGKRLEFGGIPLTLSFYSDLMEHNVMKNHGREMLVINGLRDDTVLPEEIDCFCALNPGALRLVIPSADHRFRAHGVLSEAIDAAYKYYRKKLRL